MLATVLSRPLIIVTTAITAETPTTIPTRVSEVRNLLARRLPSSDEKCLPKRSDAKQLKRAWLGRWLNSFLELAAVWLCLFIATKHGSIPLSDFFVSFNQAVTD